MYAVLKLLGESAELIGPPTTHGRSLTRGEEGAKGRAMAKGPGRYVLVNLSHFEESKTVLVSTELEEV